MLQSIKTTATVNQHGAINITSPELPIGATVEVIILIQAETQNTTEYLLSNPVNQQHLFDALEQINHSENYTYVDIEAV